MITFKQIIQQVKTSQIVFDFFDSKPDISKLDQTSWLMTEWTFLSLSLTSSQLSDWTIHWSERGFNGLAQLIQKPSNFRNKDLIEIYLRSFVLYFKKLARRFSPNSVILIRIFLTSFGKLGYMQAKFFRLKWINN